MIVDPAFYIPGNAFDPNFLTNPSKNSIRHKKRVNHLTKLFNAKKNLVELQIILVNQTLF